MAVNVSSQQLAALVAACEHNFLVEAAESLSVSQPAISQSLSELEKRIGVTLFERSGRKLVLRDDVHPVYEYARSVLASTEGLDVWLEGYKGALNGVLRVGMIDTAAVHYFADLIKAFRSDRPGLEFSLTVSPSSQLQELLLSGKLDVAVIVKPSNPHSEILTTDLMSEDITVFAPPNTSSRPADWGPWVGFPRGSHTRRLVSAALAKLGSSYDIVAESHQPEVLVEMVNQGFGWVALPSSQVERSGRKLHRVRKAPLCKRQIVVATHNQRDTAPVAEEFIGALTKASAKL